MTGYRIAIAESAKKELNAMPANLIGRIVPRIRSLAANPRPQGCKKLHGYKNQWRIRVGGYRVVYSISDAEKVVDITRIAHRGEVYYS